MHTMDTMHDAMHACIDAISVQQIPLYQAGAAMEGLEGGELGGCVVFSRTPCRRLCVAYCC